MDIDRSATDAEAEIVLPRHKSSDTYEELDLAGKFIAAEIKAAAKEKAGIDLEKANNHWIAATQRLAEARKLCALANGFSYFLTRQ